MAQQELQHMKTCPLERLGDPARSCRGVLLSVVEATEASHIAEAELPELKNLFRSLNAICSQGPRG
jgi:hypothetical protein